MDVYKDRSYTFINPIPDDLVGQILIQTCNNDRDSTTNTLIFTVNQPVIVTLAIDPIITNPLYWMNNWSMRDDILMTTDPVPERFLYEKQFNAGTISLGANYENGMIKYSSMYSVIIQSVTNNAVKDWERYP